MKLKFIGATETVTGSRTLVESDGVRVLVDCGLFQGFKRLRLKNWDAFPFDISSIDSVLLTHAHLDHSGAIPLLVKSGFRGRIYATAPTIELCRILLPDSGYLQEEEAAYANRKGFSKHKPALPLYTQKDAERCLERFTQVEFSQTHLVREKLKFSFFPVGHLPGASSVRVENSGHSVYFSGDIGRGNDPLLPRLAKGAGGDIVVIEATYGDRKHPSDMPESSLGRIIRETIANDGVVLVPSFAVGRAQLVLYYLMRLKETGVIPAELPVYLNSPMASKANEVFIRSAAASGLGEDEARRICATARVVESVDESIALNKQKGPMILIAASGMATGGRVLHHLKAFAGDPANSIVFVGFQAGGTRGEAMINGAKEIKIHGQYWPVRARVHCLDTLSAHADGDELITWLNELKQRPREVYVNHGEAAAADFLRRRIQEECGIPAHDPGFGDEVELR